MAGVAKQRDHMDAIVEQWRRERPDLNVAPLGVLGRLFRAAHLADAVLAEELADHRLQLGWFDLLAALRRAGAPYELKPTELMRTTRSEEHTSELQSPYDLVCRLLLEKKKKHII